MRNEAKFFWDFRFEAKISLRAACLKFALIAVPILASGFRSDISLTKDYYLVSTLRAIAVKRVSRSFLYCTIHLYEPALKKLSIKLVIDSLLSESLDYCIFFFLNQRRSCNVVFALRKFFRG